MAKVKRADIEDYEREALERVANLKKLIKTYYHGWGDVLDGVILTRMSDDCDRLMELVEYEEEENIKNNCLLCKAQCSFSGQVLTSTRNNCFRAA